MTVQKLHDDLDYWIHLGIADDIVRSPESRKEYQHLIVPYVGRDTILVDEIPKRVLIDLKKQLQYRPIFRKTTYVLLWLRFKRLVGI